MSLSDLVDLNNHQLKQLVKNFAYHIFGQVHIWSGQVHFNCNLPYLASKNFGYCRGLKRIVNRLQMVTQILNENQLVRLHTFMTKNLNFKFFCYQNVQCIYLLYNHSAQQLYPALVLSPLPCPVTDDNVLRLPLCRGWLKHGKCVIYYYIHVCLFIHYSHFRY